VARVRAHGVLPILHVLGMIIGVFGLSMLLPLVYPNSPPTAPNMPMTRPC
jgi:hypothetical protein